MKFLSSKTTELNENNSSNEQSDVKKYKIAGDVYVKERDDYIRCKKKTRSNIRLAHRENLYQANANAL